VLASVLLGTATTLCLVAQAGFLGTLLADAVLHRADHRAIEVGLVGLVGATVVRALFSLAGEHAARRTAEATKASLRRDALAKVISLGPVWLSSHHTGELAVTLGHGLDALDSYIGRYLPRILLAGITPAVLLIFIAHLDLLSAGILLLTLGLLPVFMILVGQLTERRVASRFRALTRLSGQFLDAVEGLATLRAYGRTAVQRTTIATATEELRRTTLATLQIALLSALVLETLAAVGTALVAVPLALRLLSGDMALAPAITILILTPEVYLPLRRASAEFHASTEGSAALDSVFALLDRPSASRESPAEAGGQPRERYNSERAVEIAALHPAAAGAVAGGTDRPQRGAQRGAQRGDSAHQRPTVELVGVSLTYPGQNAPALTSCDLVLRAGEHLGLVGPSGAGKSSVAGLITGLLQPERGAVLIDGRPLTQTVLPSWHRRLAVVPQTMTLFSGTVADNLCLGVLEASKAELFLALEVACLADTVGALPAGLDTVLGEHGIGLSAGERQRLAIARALLRPGVELFILDEPTAHLDSATEAELVRRLAERLEGRGALIIAHRPAPLTLSDRVVRLDHGRPSAAVDQLTSSRDIDGVLRAR